VFVSLFVSELENLSFGDTLSVVFILLKFKIDIFRILPSFTPTTRLKRAFRHRHHHHHHHHHHQRGGGGGGDDDNDDEGMLF